MFEHTGERNLPVGGRFQDSTKAFRIATGVTDHQSQANNHLQLEVHGPNGGLEEAELSASHGSSRGDIGEERLVVLGADDERQPAIETKSAEVFA